MKELLLKGENLQKRAPDQDKREQIRLKHNLLNSKYNTVKVTRVSRMKQLLKRRGNRYGTHPKNTCTQKPALD